MKKYLFIIILSTIYALPSFCSDTNICKIVFFKESKFSEFMNEYRIYSNDTILVRLKNNSFFEYYCKAGTHTFIVNNKKNSKIQLNTEGGRIYYLKLRNLYNPGFILTVSSELTAIDSATAVSHIYNSKMRKLEGEKFPHFRPRNRIGINIGYGPGFNRFSANNGSESDISFGGGGAFGIKYGYEINKNFDLSFCINYQGSTNYPFLENASATFERTVISITPAFIIPIKDGEDIRIKIGGGYDNYFFSQLLLKASNIPHGFNDTWKYKNASGYHASVTLEIYYSEHFSYDFILKYYAVSYLFDKSTYYYPTSDNALYNPNGEGLDLIIGFNYHF